MVARQMEREKGVSQQILTSLRVSRSDLSCHGKAGFTKLRNPPDPVAREPLLQGPSNKRCNLVALYLTFEGYPQWDRLGPPERGAWLAHWENFI